MKILIVTNTYPPADISGVGALVYELARRLHDEQHEVRVLTREMASDDSWVVKTGPSKRWFPLAAARVGWRLCRRHRFDLVHVHESDGGLLCLVLRLARWLGRPWARAPLVATLQVSYDEEERAVRPIFDGARKLSQPTSEELSFSAWRAPLLSRLGRWTAGLSDAVVAPSTVTAEELRNDYQANIAEVIPNGVRLPGQMAERESPTGDAQRPPVVLYAGRLRTRKAVAVLVEAFARVVESHPAARLLLAGEGEQRDALERQTAELGLATAVEFLGPVRPSEMPRLYAEADLFCLPSIYEGMPLAILEAMAAGLPVVSTTVSGIPEAVDHGVSGLLVEPEDATALATALLALLDDPPRRHAMGRAARHRIEAGFTIERITGLYLELWKQLIQKPGSA